MYSSGNLKSGIIMYSALVSLIFSRTILFQILLPITGLIASVAKHCNILLKVVFLLLKIISTFSFELTFTPISNITNYK